MFPPAHSTQTVSKRLKTPSTLSRYSSTPVVYITLPGRLSEEGVSTVQAHFAPGGTIIEWGGGVVMCFDTRTTEAERKPPAHLAPPSVCFWHPERSTEESTDQPATQGFSTTLSASSHVAGDSSGVALGAWSRCFFTTCASRVSFVWKRRHMIQQPSCARTH